MNIASLSPELQDRAIKQLCEVQDKVPHYVLEMQDWLTEHKYIKGRKDDHWIIAFLRGCKYNMDDTKMKMDTHYTMKTLTPKLFLDRDPFKQEIQEMLTKGVVLPLPNVKGSAGPNIWLMRPGLIKTSEMFTMVKVTVMLLDICFNEKPQLSIGGGQCIVDLANVDKDQFVTHFDTWQTLVYCYTNCYPSQFKGMCYFNAPVHFDKVFEKLQTLKFLTEDNQSMVSLYSESNFQEMGKVIDFKSMPVDYGGQSKSTASVTTYWKNKVESYKDWFLEDLKYGTQESKRTEGPKTTEEFYEALDKRTVILD